MSQLPTYSEEGVLPAHIADKFEEGWVPYRVPPQWLPVIEEMDEKLTELIPGVTYLQIKQKFDELRVYWNSPENISDEVLLAGGRIVAEAEAKAWRVDHPDG